MKSLSILFLVLVVGSCQKQQNVDSNRAKKASIDSMQMEMSKQKAIDSMRLEMAKIRNAKERRQHVTVVNPPAVPAPAPAKKKKWSGAAKGAVIGAGVGEPTGAIISRKKGEGAVIGGILGAGVGAGTGAIIDDTTKNTKK